VTVERVTRIAVAFARQITRPHSCRLSLACVDLLAVDGAGITIMYGLHSSPMCMSDERIAALEDVQFATGEGPSRDAFRSGSPVHVPYFDSATLGRWPTFGDLAKSVGAGAVFAYPLQTHGAKIGVLALYRRREGDLNAAESDDALTIVEVLTETVLSIQDDAFGGTADNSLDGGVAYRAEIYQASGMVSVQLGIPVADAMLRIRAHAFAFELSVATVAAQVVARRLRLDDDRPQLPERP
jgi:hypothetical protein